MIETPALAKADKLTADARRRISTIAANQTLTESARRAQIAAQYVQLRRQCADLRREHEEIIESQRRELTRHALGHHDMAALRTALDVASTRLASADQAATALRRADSIGDATTAHATFLIARERNWGGVVAQYLAGNADIAAHVARLEAFEQRASDRPLFTSFHPIRPDELRGVGDHHLEELAAQATPGAAPAVGASWWRG